MDLQLKGKLALVSGSTAGIGLAIATALARKGARVIINGRAQASVDTVVAEVKAATKGDVQGSRAISAGGRRGRGGAQVSGSRDPGQQSGHFRAEGVRGNPRCRLDAVLRRQRAKRRAARRLFLPAMKRANWGRIIFISSESGVQIPAEMIHYGMTKAAQIAVSRGLAEAVAGTGITVNSVLPGPTKSRGVDEFVETLAKSSGKTFEQFEKEFFEKVRPTSLIKRFASADEVASLVTYVSSPLASATTGACAPASMAAW